MIKLGKSSVLGAFLSVAEVIVPEAVYEEAVVMGKKEMYENAFELERLLQEGRASVVSMGSDGRAEKALEGGPSLGLGERAALHLAYSEEVDVILTDDRQFLSVLNSVEIKALVPAAAGVLLAERGIVSVEEAVRALGKIENSIRREVRDAAMEKLGRMRKDDK